MSEAQHTPWWSCKVLTVEPKVLGEGLSHKELEALRDEVADGPGVLVQAAGGKALVGRVEEDEQLPPLRTGRGQ